MDPTLDHSNLDPPSEPVMRRGLLPALVLNGLLLGAFAWGFEWDGNARELLQRSTPALEQVVARLGAGMQYVRAGAEQAYAGIRQAEERLGDLLARAAQRDPSRPAAGVASVPEPPPPAVAVEVRTICPIGPQLVAATPGDGQVLPPASVRGQPASEAVALLAQGDALTAGGRAHDAEVSFLTACRIADAAQGNTSVLAADTRHRLARHYALAAARLEPREHARMLRWSLAFLADAVQVYRARLGESDAKTRLAAQDLKNVQQAVGAAKAVAGSAVASASTGRVAMGAGRATGTQGPGREEACGRTAARPCR